MAERVASRISRLGAHLSPEEGPGGGGPALHVHETSAGEPEAHDT